MLIWYIYRITSRKWIIEHFTRSFFGYDRFIMMFLSDQMFCFDVIFITFIYVDFIWNKRGIMWLYDIFLLWIFSFLLRYIHIIFIWLTYNWLVIDLFLSDCSIIMVLFFCELLWFIVSCFLVDILINIIVCNALYYNDL